MVQPVGQTAVERTSAGAAAPRLYIDHDSLWAALTEDVQRPILIISGEGRIAYANELFARLLDEQPARLIGRLLPDILPSALAGERVAIVRRALTQDRPLMFIERIRGKWARTIIRRVRDTGAPAARGDAYAMAVFLLGAPPPMMRAPGAGGEGHAHGHGPGAHEHDDNGWTARYEVVHAASDDPGQLANLSKRELEVLALIGEGLSTRDIAKRLGRTIKTVEWHRASLGRKLNITNRVELAQIAIGAGMVRQRGAGGGVSEQGRP